MMPPTTAFFKNVDVAQVASRLADHLRREGADAKRFPTAQLAAVAHAGLLEAALPERFGGEPDLHRWLLPLLKEVGRASLPLGRVFEGHVNALLLIDAYGTERQMERAAEDVIERRQVFGVWNTGPEGNPQLTPLAGDRLRMSGGKTFATGAGHIGRALVTAALPDRGWQMCIVPLSEVEINIEPGSWDPLGMEASESSAVDFSGVVLNSDALLGRPGDYYTEPMFTAGALRFCAVQLGGAQALFDSVCDFLNAQGRGNDPLQLQRVGEMAVLLESGAQWLERAAEQHGRPIGVQAHMTRVAVEEIATRVIHLTEVSVGARGLATAEPFARTLRDLQMYLRQGGYDGAFQVAGRHALEVRLACV